MRLFGVASLLLAILTPQLLTAADIRSWESALAGMHFPPGSPPLQRSNVIRNLLRAFQSNDVVKAVVVLPGVADELYLIHRDGPPLNLEVVNLRDTLVALTNRTAIRVEFRDPFLLLHAAALPALAEPRVDRPETLRRLAGRHPVPRLIWEDIHWAHLQPVLRRALSLAINPASASEEAWHFERVNIAGCNLSQWETLTAVAWATGTEVTVRKRAASFARRTAP